MTHGALGLISTVRIGAGAGRELAHTRPSGDTDQPEGKFTARKKRPGTERKRTEAFKKRTEMSAKAKSRLTL
jgi:hypothetical protein